MKVIINADDFGLTNGVNAGICRTMLEGVVTSTTLMINMPAAKGALQMADAQDINSIGLHLVLDCGKPVLPASEIASLVDANGCFYRRIFEQLDYFDKAQIDRELRAQIELFMSYGRRPTHLDSHHHVHTIDGVAEIVIRLAAEFDLPVRMAAETPDENSALPLLNREQMFKITNKYKVRTPAVFSPAYYGKRLLLEDLLTIIDKYKEGNIEALELMCHPAIVDEQLAEISSYTFPRESELDILTSARLKSALITRGVILTDFARVL